MSAYRTSEEFTEMLKKTLFCIDLLKDAIEDLPVYVDVDPIPVRSIGRFKRLSMEVEHQLREMRKCSKKFEYIPQSERITPKVKNG